MGAIRDWATASEEALWSSAKLSRGLSHAGTKGGAREQQFMDLLGRFLPQVVSVGAGQIVDFRGDLSCQIDCLGASADTFRLPLAERGSAIYPIEAVLAVFEIKSRLDKTSLAAGVDTLASVAKLGFAARMPDIRSPEDIEAGAMLTEAQVAGMPTDELYPCPYLYAYSTSYKNLLRALTRALSSLAPAREMLRASWPSVVACPGAVGLKNDGVLIEDGAFGRDWAFALREETHPLYWVLCHLLRRVSAVARPTASRHIPAEYVIEAHFDPQPEGGWTLIPSNEGA